MRILIDARLYGPKHTGNGRYTQNLIENLAKLDKKNNYIILLRTENFKNIDLPHNFLKVETDFRHYSFTEQLKLPFIILKYKPDIVHFPHFNVPIFYFGKYIVTIHDLIMHKFKGGQATIRNPLTYLVWRVGYYLSFAKAVHGSRKIIVPSYVVKKDLLKFYKINEKKIEVVYE